MINEGRQREGGGEVDVFQRGIGVTIVVPTDTQPNDGIWVPRNPGFYLKPDTPPEDIAFILNQRPDLKKLIKR